MKKITLYALIGIGLLLLVNIYYFITSIIAIMSYDVYNVQYLIAALLRMVGVGMIFAFFLNLYKMQNNEKNS